MTRIGLWGARADAGGLAAMTYEFARHMRPAATVVIDLGTRGRGPAHPERYGRLGLGNVWVNPGMDDEIPLGLVRDFLAGVDVVYMAETSYYEPFCDLAREAGVVTVLHAMPELWRAEMAQPDVVWVPTGWERDRIDRVTFEVPVPVPTDVFAPDPDLVRAGFKRGAMLHMEAPAFHDRNGTDLLVQAMAETTRPVRIVFSGNRRPPSVANHRGGRVDTAWWSGHAVDRIGAYPPGCGALILPRRYAGLSLPMQEAAGMGWPIISLDLEPQRGWLHPDLLVRAEPVDKVRMAGGWFDVHGCQPVHLARAIDRLVESEQVWREARERSLDRAADLSWQRWTPIYQDLLAEAATRRATA